MGLLQEKVTKNSFAKYHNWKILGLSLTSIAKPFIMQPVSTKEFNQYLSGKYLMGMVFFTATVLRYLKNQLKVYNIYSNVSLSGFISSHVTFWYFGFLLVNMTRMTVNKSYFTRDTKTRRFSYVYRILISAHHTIAVWPQS